MSVIRSAIQWEQAAEGIWRGVVGVPEAVTPLTVSPPSPRREALAALGDAPFPLPQEQVVATVGAGRIVLRLPLGESDRLYGFGLQFLRMNHRGRTRCLRVNSDPVVDTGETHAPLPFWVSSAGYAVLIDTARVLTVYAGSAVRLDSERPPKLKNRGYDEDWAATPLSDSLEAVVPGETGVAVYVFAGAGDRGDPQAAQANAMLSAVRRYNLFCGGGPLPPRWGLGFWHRVSMFASDAEVAAEADEFRQRDIPCDVIGLEPGWHSHCYPTSFEWDAARFPDPAGFVRGLTEKGFRINVWEHPYVSPASPLYEPLLPYAGSHTVWGGLAPDYADPRAASILAEHHRERHVGLGVAGYKLDEVDGSELTGSSWMFPAHASFPSGLDGERMRQLYGVLLQRLTAGLFRERDRRTYGLVRASNAGAVSSPYALYTDLYDSRQFVRALCNSGFGGLLWSPEVREAQTDEAYVRRLQIACLSPLAMMNAWASGQRPWSYPGAEAAVRAAIRLRMRLMPYLYSAFARYREDGTPPFRAMALETGYPFERLGPEAAGFDSTAAPYGLYGEDRSIDDQYMMGDSVLVAPLFPGERSRAITLPAGDWYEFETGASFPGGRTIEYAAPLERVPMFVRDGGIVPLMPSLPHAPKAGDRVPLEIRVYGKAPGVFRLYDDDGETFAFERGHCRWTTLRSDGTSEPLSGGGEAYAYGELIWRHMGDPSSASAF
ncbi:TIM-barrel domain-containing protein [Cohnella fermenti]|uniref:Glycoside hydrolase family 31 protein n=1 Tax=Cohnella fermenti TaxID=2565925 RepID=A0A4S4BRG6_9BACL|nr:TIM-barrel domain-containing protein [Cohnella fermenti]THF75255.1 glycoside hydrolase family 31 protein [Cohnella fermenti]